MASLADRILASASVDINTDVSVSKEAPKLTNSDENITENVSVTPHLIGRFAIPENVVIPESANIEISQNTESKQTVSDITVTLRSYLKENGVKSDIADIITMDDFDKIGHLSKNINTKMWVHRKKGEQFTIADAMKPRTLSVKPKKKISPKEADYSAQIAELAAGVKKQGETINQIAELIVHANQSGRLNFR